MTIEEIKAALKEIRAELNALEVQGKPVGEVWNKVHEAIIELVLIEKESGNDPDAAGDKDEAT